MYGSVAVMKTIPGIEVKPGDIVSFIDAGTREVVTHRVAGYAPGSPSLITKGDANTIPDPQPIPVGNVQARYLFAVPYAGSAIHWMQSREAYLAVILVPGTLIILYELGSIVHALRRNNETMQSY